MLCLRQVVGPTLSLHMSLLARRSVVLTYTATLLCRLTLKPSSPDDCRASAKKNRILLCLLTSKHSIPLPPDCPKIVFREYQPCYEDPSRPIRQVPRAFFGQPPPDCPKNRFLQVSTLFLEPSKATGDFSNDLSFPRKGSSPNLQFKLILTARPSRYPRDEKDERG